MRSTSKANGARGHRASNPARSTASPYATPAKRKTRGDGNDERMALRLDDMNEPGLEEDLDLDNLDYDALDTDDIDSPSADWLADRDLALAIAARTLN